MLFNSGSGQVRAGGPVEPVPGAAPCAGGGEKESVGLTFEEAHGLLLSLGQEEVLFLGDIVDSTTANSHEGVLEVIVRLAACEDEVPYGNILLVLLRRV